MWELVAAFIVGFICTTLGMFSGAFIVHRSRANRSPVPFTESFVRIDIPDDQETPKEPDPRNT